MLLIEQTPTNMISTTSWFYARSYQPPGKAARETGQVVTFLALLLYALWVVRCKTLHSLPLRALFVALFLFAFIPVGW